MPATELDALSLVRQMLTKYCDAPADAMVPEATLAELNVDSLALAEMLFALEDRVGAAVGDPVERPRTVGDLARLVEPLLPTLAAGPAN